MASRRYYTLIASLPPLPHFGKARRLPITRERLEGRLSMLSDEDYQLVERLETFLRWQRQTRERSDAVIAADYQALHASIDGTPCARLVEQVVNQRTVMVALRRRQRGLEAPDPTDPWGLGPWVGPLGRNWEHPEFGLGAVFPWIGRARDLLEQGEALELERFLTGLGWDWLSRAQPVDPFRFEALLVYLFRWSLLEQWLSYSTEKAEPRFEQLVTEAIGDYDQLLH